jgi:hypothetical protein
VNVKRLRLTGNRTRVRNWLNRRAWARGLAPLPDRVSRQVSPRVPVYRNRINPGTGRPHRDDRQTGAVQDRALARRGNQQEQAAHRTRPARTRGRRSR